MGNWGTRQKLSLMSKILLTPWCWPQRKIDDGSPINAGRDDRITLNASSQTWSLRLINWHPTKIIHDTSKPQGVASRAADLTRTRKILGWQPTSIL